MKQMKKMGYSALMVLIFLSSTNGFLQRQIQERNIDLNKRVQSDRNFFGNIWQQSLKETRSIRKQLNGNDERNRCASNDDSRRQTKDHFDKLVRDIRSIGHQMDHDTAVNARTTRLEHSRVLENHRSQHGDYSNFYRTNRQRYQNQDQEKREIQDRGTRLERSIQENDRRFQDRIAPESRSFKENQRHARTKDNFDRNIAERRSSQVNREVRKDRSLNGRLQLVDDIRVFSTRRELKNRDTRQGIDHRGPDRIIAERRFCQDNREVREDSIRVAGSNDRLKLVNGIRVCSTRRELQNTRQGHDRRNIDRNTAERRSSQDKSEFRQDQRRDVRSNDRLRSIDDLRVLSTRRESQDKDRRQERTIDQGNDRRNLDRIIAERRFSQDNREVREDRIRDARSNDRLKLVNDIRVFSTRRELQNRNTRQGNDRRNLDRNTAERRSPQDNSEFRQDQRRDVRSNDKLQSVNDILVFSTRREPQNDRTRQDNERRNLNRNTAERRSSQENREFSQDQRRDTKSNDRLQSVDDIRVFSTRREQLFRRNNDQKHTSEQRSVEHDRRNMELNDRFIKNIRDLSTRREARRERSFSQSRNLDRRVNRDVRDIKFEQRRNYQQINNRAVDSRREVRTDASMFRNVRGLEQKADLQKSSRFRQDLNSQQIDSITSRRQTRTENRRSRLDASLQNHLQLNQPSRQIDRVRQVRTFSNTNIRSIGFRRNVVEEKINSLRSTGDSRQDLDQTRRDIINRQFARDMRTIKSVPEIRLQKMEHVYRHNIITDRSIRLSSVQPRRVSDATRSIRSSTDINNNEAIRQSGNPESRLATSFRNYEQLNGTTFIPAKETNMLLNATTVLLISILLLQVANNSSKIKKNWFSNFVFFTKEKVL